MNNSLKFYQNSALIIFFLLSTLTSSNGQSNALHFDGHDDFSQLLDFSIQGDFTFSYWFKADDNVSFYDDRIVSWGASNRLEIGIADRNCQNSQLWLYDPLGGGVRCNSGVNLRDGNWHQIAFVKNNGTVLIYVDGELLYNYYSASNASYGPYFRLGAWTGSIATRTGFAGTLDEVRIWDHARSLEQITENSTIELSGTESGLLSYYDFNQGIPAGDNTAMIYLIDKTTNENNMMLYNFNLDGETSNFIGSDAPILNDSDSDGILDKNDNCPSVYNPDQLDADFDLIGDLCDESFDLGNVISVLLDSISTFNITGINGINSKLFEINDLCEALDPIAVIEKLNSLRNQINAKIGKGITEEEAQFFLQSIDLSIQEILNGNSSCTDNEAPSSICINQVFLINESGQVSVRAGDILFYALSDNITDSVDIEIAFDIDFSIKNIDFTCQDVIVKSEPLKLFFRDLQGNVDSCITSYLVLDVYSYCDNSNPKTDVFNRQLSQNASPILFPNPVREMLYIKSAINSNVLVVNQLGQVVSNTKGNEVNTSTLPSGIYIAIIKSNGKVYKEKFLKH